MRSNTRRAWVICFALTAILPVAAAAGPPDKLFAGKSQRVPPRQYAEAAIAADIDVTGPQAGRKSLLIRSTQESSENIGRPGNPVGTNVF